MSKLRAEITYSHRLNSDTNLENTFNININESLINQNRENNVTIPMEDNQEIPMEEELDNDINQPNLENEFSEYLQDWVDMLKEEELALDENEFENNTIVDDVTHPAHDNDAKWELITLFKDNLKLPF